MGRKDKLIEKLRTNPRAFTYAEAVSLLNCVGYYEDNKGKTSGSRVVFRKDGESAKYAMHKPHPQKELKEYQAKSLLEHLEAEGLI